MQYELLIAFFLIYLIDSVTPGPAVAMVVSRGLSIGLLRTLPFIAGLVVGELVLFCAAMLGLAALAKTLGPLFIVIKWIGISYLLYLAYTMWKSDPVLAPATAAATKGWRSFLLAIVLPLGNPKAVGFYIALLPAFLDVSTLSLFTAINFSIVIVLVWGGVLVVYTALADRGHKLYRTTSLQRWLNRSSAGLMVGTAGVIAFRE